jgi:hypothetical protein
MNEYKESDKFEYKNVTKKFVLTILQNYLLDKSIELIVGHTLHSSTLGRDNHSYYFKKVKNHLIVRNTTLDKDFDIRIIPRYFQNSIIVKNI